MSEDQHYIEAYWENNKVNGELKILDNNGNLFKGHCENELFEGNVYINNQNIPTNNNSKYIFSIIIYDNNYVYKGQTLNSIFNRQIKKMVLESYIITIN